jgi:glycosyltransferase involved in cell wall biosynthesis
MLLINQNMDKYNFKDVTLLITHYNRSNSLERLLKSFLSLNCEFEEIIVSDDGSNLDHLNYIKTLQNDFKFNLITTPINKGLGNNINKGQDAVKTQFTLYVQEDFVPTELFSINFKEGLEILHERIEIDVIRFYAYFKYPYLKYYKNGYSEMIFNIFYPGYKKYYYYSDHPHLRRSNFFNKFGRYKEGIKVELTEYKMMMAFIQRGGKSLFHEKFQELFIQMNSEIEPSTVKRTKLRESKNIIIIILRHYYRHFKFNFDYLFRKF